MIDHIYPSCHFSKMVDINNMVKLVRMGVFATTSVFALLVVILSGLVINYTSSLFGVFFSYAALGIATGLLTLLTLPAMLAFSIYRKGAFTSMIAVEVGWIWFLWILWIAVGGNSATGFILFGSCSSFDVNFVPPGFGAACSESQAITAFGFLSWILLLFYNAVLFTLAIRQHLRGNTGIWTKDVTDTDFTAPPVNYNTPIVFENKAPVYPNQYPPAGSPIGSQQTGSYTQAGVPYPGQAPGLYAQQGATGSFTQPQVQTYPQV